jgi:hypothetical protein
MVKISFLLLSVLLASASGVTAGDLRDIELRRLFEPTPVELHAERAGLVYIYDGVRDTDIERAMAEQFDRIQSMMFIRTQMTDKTGHLKRDEATGAIEVEDDGC